MNEVRMTVPASQVPARAASSKGAEDIQAKVEGKGLPDTAKVDDVKPQGIAPETLETAVAEINNFVQLVQRDLEFTVDDELDRTVVKVVDSHSGELIRQIPEDIFLELARKLKDDGELHLVNALG